MSTTQFEDLVIKIGSSPGKRRKTFFSSQLASERVITNTKRVREMLENIGPKAQAEKNLSVTDESTSPAEPKTTSEEEDSEVESIHGMEHIYGSSVLPMDEDAEEDGIDGCSGIEAAGYESSHDTDSNDGRESVASFCTSAYVDYDRYSRPVLLRSYEEEDTDSNADTTEEDTDEDKPTQKAPTKGLPAGLCRIHCRNCDNAFAVLKDLVPSLYNSTTFLCHFCSPEAMAMQRSLRPVSTDIRTLTDALNAIEKARNIVVVAGAGISVSTGIPDFRSENGLYEIMRGQVIGETSHALAGTDLFDLDFFKRDPSAFFHFMWVMDAVTRECTPTPMHRFLYQLQQHGKLRRVYTQNIDGLELMSGLVPEKVVACHGSAVTSTCTLCGLSLPTEMLRAGFHDQRRIPYCDSVRKELLVTLPPAQLEELSIHDEHCALAAIEVFRHKLRVRARQREQELALLESAGLRAAVAQLGLSLEEYLASRRLAEDADDELPGNVEEEGLEEHLRGREGGVLKPDIVFFGESLPDHLSTCLLEDADDVDLVLVMGTSLQVAPVSGLPAKLALDAPLILINRESVRAPNAVAFDYELLGSADAVAAHLAKHLGWEL